MQYRRSQTAGGTYFFTIVTDARRRFLCEPQNIALLRSVFTEIKGKHPFTLEAFVILPDHLHCLWTLPAGDFDYSMRWRQIKSAFSRQCEQQYKGEATRSLVNKQEQPVWQRRFWEHEIQNELDFQNHVEYIHYNPVKHGLTKAPMDWQYSSFHRYVDQGIYPYDWGAEKPVQFGDTTGPKLRRGVLLGFVALYPTYILPLSGTITDQRKQK